MKNKLSPLFFLLTLLAGIHQAAVQNARFFRIAGPARWHVGLEQRDVGHGAIPSA